MRLLKPILVALAIGAAGSMALVVTGHLDVTSIAKLVQHEPKPSEAAPAPLPPAVTVAYAERTELIETVLVTGTLVARDEILVAPEVEGLRVLNLNVDVGDSVRKGDVLATLVRETLEAQLAQNDAAIARAAAQTEQARSEIAAAEARLEEANAQFERAKPLQKSGYLSDSIYDQRRAAARTSEAQLAAARDGLKLAEAERAQLEAQRRELVWRLAKSDVRAPTDGLISRRNARIGGLATGVGEPMFRIVRDGEVELDAEVTEGSLAKIRVGQSAVVDVAGAATIVGKVRLVAPEVERATRLGRVRISLGNDPALHIGGFARGTISTAKSTGIAVPISAVMYSSDGPSVQVVVGGKVASRRITTGLTANGMVEVRSGLAAGDVVVARSGTFLRDGDEVRPLLPTSKVSEASR